MKCFIPINLSVCLSPHLKIKSIESFLVSSHSLLVQEDILLLFALSSAGNVREYILVRSYLLIEVLLVFIHAVYVLFSFILLIFLQGLELQRDVSRRPSNTFYIFESLFSLISLDGLLQLSAVLLLAH